MITIYKDHFETEAELEAAISDAKKKKEIWRTSEGIPAPIFMPEIKQILDGDEYEYIDLTIKEQAQIKADEATRKIEDEMLEAQTTPSPRYAEFRFYEYPPIPDQLDYIYHNGIDAWKTDMVDPVKAKYPKQEA